MESEMWGSMLDVLKDMRDYLEKQDAVQEKAKIDKPPKAQETMKPIVGGKSPVGSPGTGVAKQYVAIPKEDTSAGEDTESSLEGDNEGTLLKEDEDEVEDVPDEEVSTEDDEKEEDEDEKATSDEELKSLLKAIHRDLSKQVDTASVIAAEVKKSLPAHVDKMLRKMGFTPTKPDIVKLGMGIDSNAEVRKSEDNSEVKGDIAKTEDQIAKGVKDMTKLSWQELGQIREKEGLFKPF